MKQGLVLLPLLLASVYQCHGAARGCKCPPSDHTCSDSTTTCFPCFFVSNCDGASCLYSSTGDLCERCTSGYSQIGSSCVECPIFYWAMPLLFIIIFLFALTVHQKGLTPSVCIKIKQLFDFCQFVLLTVSFQVAWPRLKKSQHIIYFLSFAYVNPKMILPDCWWSGLTTDYFTLWLGSVLPFIILLVALYIINHYMRLRQARTTSGRTWLRRRRGLFRIATLLALIYYFPITSLSLRSYSCEKNLNNAYTWYYNGSKPQSNTNRWSFNLRVSCSSPEFQTVTFFSTLILAVYSTIGPVLLLFVTLRLKRWKLLDKKPKPLYRPLYDSYRPRWCFTEPINLIRKLLFIALTDIYPLDGRVQSLIALTTTIFYLTFAVLSRPFGPGKWQIKSLEINMHSLFEIAANVCLLGMHAVAVATSFQPIESDSNSSADWVMFTLVGLPLLVWLGLFIGHLFKEQPEGNDADDDELNEEIREAANIQSRPLGKLKLLFQKRAKRIVPAKPEHDGQVILFNL